MYPAVHLAVVLDAEPLVADVAREGLLARVDALVVDEAVLLGELLVAGRALERLHLEVRLEMDLQVVATREGLVAEAALDPLRRLVACACLRFDSDFAVWQRGQRQNIDSRAHEVWRREGWKCRE